MTTTQSTPIETFDILQGVLQESCDAYDQNDIRQGRVKVTLATGQTIVGRASMVDNVSVSLDRTTERHESDFLIHVRLAAVIAVEYV